MTAVLRLVEEPAKVPRLKRALVADLFCGAGGTSTGAIRALAKLGIKTELTAVNHWQIAVNTHELNHIDARHFCQDIGTLRPLEAIPEGKLDLLCASPTCTFHSRARGGRPIHDQQRQDPWMLIRWLTELRVKRLLVENVPEFVNWGPVDPKAGKPLKSKRGEYFAAWVQALEGVGMRCEWRVLCAADFGDATTRERFFLQGRSDGKPVRWPLPTHSKTGAGLPGMGLRKWKPAREIIEWNRKGRSIFNRKKPLSPKTLARMLAGAIKFRWPLVFRYLLEEHIANPALQLADLMAIPRVARAAQEHEGSTEAFIFASRTNNVAKDVGNPLPTATASAGGGGFGVVEPLVMRTDMHQSNAGCVFSPNDPLRTVTTSGGFGVAEPFVQMTRTGSAPRSPDEPAPTITGAGMGGLSLVEPMVVTLRNHADGRSVDDPLPALTAGGTHVGLAEPFILSPASGGAPRGTTEPVPAIVAGTNAISHTLVEPFVLSQASCGAPRTVNEPVPTITTDGAHALISPYYGDGSGKTCKAVTAPLDTITTRDRFGLVVPITQTGASLGSRVRDVVDPLATILPSHGGEFALVAPVTHHDGSSRARSVEEPLPSITGAHRGELACIVAQFGERPGQTPRVHSVEEPVPTLCANGRVQLAEAVRFDILFRMLAAPELAAATGWDPSYRFTGSNEEVIKQIGNAVPVGLAEALVSAAFGGGA